MCDHHGKRSLREHRAHIVRGIIIIKDKNYLDNNAEMLY